MGVTAWLLLRAFASGCTAMTGVEAVSNGINAFREPTVRRGHLTLAAIVAILGVLLAVIAYLAQAYGIGAMDQTRPGYQSVLSQLTGAVVGRGPVYFVTIGSVLAVLCLSANTSFVDFPRLCRLVSQDAYLPRTFAMPGRRLVYSAGILWLAIAAGFLLTLFGGITDRLIPLFAVGAFTAFTLSQLGMARHWQRQPGNRLRFLINGMGAAGTGAALGVILSAKFLEGAWITVVVIPCVVIILKLIKRYYDVIGRQLHADIPLDLHALKPPLALIPIVEWNRLTEKAVRYALSVTPEVIAIHLTMLEGPDAEEHNGRLRRQWRNFVELPAQQAGIKAPQLVLSPSPYRSLVGHLLRAVQETEARFSGRPILVIIPELIKQHWWDYVLMTRRAHLLRAALMRHGGPDLAVVVVPWARDAPRPEKIIDEEEPPAAAARSSRGGKPLARTRGGPTAAGT